MGVSLYHYAFRETPLSESEWEAVRKIVGAFEKRIEAKLEDDDVEDFWEAPSIYELNSPSYKPHRADTVLSGSTGVRTDEQVEYWSHMVSEIRGAVHGAEWDVRLESDRLEWRESEERFRFPSQPERHLHRVYFSDSVPFEGSEFVRLAAESLNLAPDSPMSSIEDALIDLHGDHVELRFTHDDSVSPERLEGLRSARLLWALFGEEGPYSDRVHIWWQDKVDRED